MIRDIKQRASAYISLLKAQRHGRQVPLVSNLFFLTGVCNSNCAYCYVDMKSKPEREYDLDGWLKLIDDLVERGTKIFSLVGGEPLLSPYVREIVDHIYSKNLFITFTSNGYLVRKNMDIVKKASVVSISIDGNEESHNKARGKGLYKKGYGWCSCLSRKPYTCTYQHCHHQRE